MLQKEEESVCVYTSRDISSKHRLELLELDSKLDIFSLFLILVWKVLLSKIF